MGISLTLLYLCVIAAGDANNWTAWTRSHPLRWLAFYLLYCLASVSWTAAPSTSAAAGYWTASAADTLTALVLLSDPSVFHPRMESLLKGAVWGGVLLAVVGWLSPGISDLRLGDELFLHPNTLGLQLGITALVAQYLALGSRIAWWLPASLAITLLRTLSKTSITAFILASGWYLFRTPAISRQRKIRLVIVASIVVLLFSSLLLSYAAIYSNTGSGNQPETLTGRTIIWTTAIGLGLDTPWIGHGLYSFRFLIPAFGDFEPWHAHNELIQIFFEFGLIGLALAIAVHWKFWRFVRSLPQCGARLLAVSVFIFALLHGLTDTVLFGFSYPLWLMTSLCLFMRQATVAEEVLP